MRRSSSSGSAFSIVAGGNLMRRSSSSGSAFSIVAGA
jgi:uncharacterized protein YoaH (UPF0181 family)